MNEEDVNVVRKVLEAEGYELSSSWKPSKEALNVVSEYASERYMDGIQTPTY